MKVVHVSTSDSGGAAISCLRLHVALLEVGVDSSLLTLSKKKTVAHHFTYNHKVPLTFLQRIMYRLGLGQPAYKQHEAALVNKVKGYEHFSFTDSGIDLENSSVIKDADIINLHWVSGFVDVPSFFRKIKKPIVWTLHDMNAFSGGCHYSSGCEKYKKDCDVCPQLQGTKNPSLSKEQLIIKQKNYSDADITIVTPSHWLASCARSSTLLKNRNVHVIPYSLNLQVFRIVDKSEARKKIKLPTDKKIILFVSSSIENKRKGLDILMESILKIERPEEYIICSVGQNAIATKYSNHISLGEIKEEEQMMLAYNAADVFVLPATEDNLPNVALEALACGVPVIGFNIGGMPDMVKPGLNGLLGNTIEPKALADLITHFFSDTTRFDRLAIRRDAEVRYNNELQAGSYLSLYKSLLKK